MSYQSELTNKKYVPNVVIRLRSQYFSIRQPDSGLTIDSDKVGLISSLSLNPTSIDPFRATTAINSNSFRILDKNKVITNLFGSNPEFFQGNLCEIWLGRVGVNMPFSDYLKLTDTYITKVTRADGAYSFSTREAKDRINKDIYVEQNKLDASILSGTTIITLQSPPTNTSGTFKINNEIISYSGVSGNQLTGCVRGLFSTTPAAHDFGDDVYFGEVVTGNPIDILLKILISSGGGGVYDVLLDGAAIDQNLIDIEQFESIRDEYFTGVNYDFKLFNIQELKKFIEDEILFPTGTRLRSNNNSKIGLAIITKARINIDAPTIDHDQLTRRPSYSVDENKVINQIKIEWGYNFGTDKYESISFYEDAASVAEFGKSKVLSLKFKGVTTQSQVDDIAANFLRRFAYPKPVLDVNAHMTTSEWLLGELPRFESTLIPNDLGDLNFADSVEITQKAINYQTGDVKFQLQVTQFTGIRLCFLAPSDTIPSFTSQSIVNVGAGRGELYRVGWKMRLYNNSTRDYTADSVNEISSISGDQITFLNPWSTTLVNNGFKITFANYNDVTEQQKKFCFISDDSNNFSDGTKPYQIIF